MGKHYAGTRNTNEELSVVIVHDSGATEELPLRLDLRNHSPSGFEAGYGGSGPAQLALAILCDALDDDQRAIRIYQQFKFRVIASLPRDRDWTIEAYDVITEAETIEALAKKRA